MTWEDNIDSLQRELNSYERGAAAMERQMDRLIDEINQLKRENQRLTEELAMRQDRHAS